MSGEIDGKEWGGGEEEDRHEKGSGVGERRERARQAGRYVGSDTCHGVGIITYKNVQIGWNMGHRAGNT